MPGQVPESNRQLVISAPNVYLAAASKEEVPGNPEKLFHSHPLSLNEPPQVLPVNKDVWVRYSVWNRTGKDTLIYFCAGNQQSIKAYEDSAGKLRFIGETGMLAPASALNIPGNRLGIRISIPASSTSIIYTRTRNYTIYNVDPFAPKLLAEQDFLHLTTASKELNTSSDVGYAFCFGILAVMFIYVLIKFIFLKDKAYQFYALSTFSALTYFLLNYLQRPFHDYLFSENPFALYVIADPFLILHIISYPLFVAEFLKLKQNDKWLLRLIVRLAGFFGMYIVLSAVYVAITKDINTRVVGNQTLAIVIGALALFAAYRIYRIKKNKIEKALFRILFLGISFMLTFYLLSLILGTVKEQVRANSQTSNFLHLDLLLVGSVIEVLFFTIALGSRDRMLETERVHHILQRERAEKRRAQLERRIAELQLTLLLSQLKPHFIFNCLGTIEYYIYTNPDEAGRLLQLFARLTRSILENSRRKLVSVRHEIATLESYLALERARSSYQFSYNITTDNDNIKELELPPMIVQPLIENAIIHGLRPRFDSEEVKGTVNIVFRRQEGCLLIGVEDDGIGLRKKADPGINDGRKPFKKNSLGLNIIKDILRNVWNDENADKYLKITEKVPPESGVLAELLLPIKELQ